jgi:cytochrome P450
MTAFAATPRNAPETSFAPRPTPLPSLLALMRCVLRGDGDLLSLLPKAAYSAEIGPLGYSRRSTVVVNRPDLAREVLADPAGILPKSDLMVNALAPLIGDSIFVSSGATWRRQRAMIDPALTMMRINRAFPAMEAAAEAAEETLAARARDGEAFSLDLDGPTTPNIKKLQFSKVPRPMIGLDEFDGELAEVSSD